MAIAFDAASGATNNSTPLSHTCSGADRLLVVAITGDNADNLTGVTYAGVAMTLGVKLNYTADRWNYFYYLVNPALGANDIAVTGLTYKSITGISYTGVDQSSPIDSTYSNFFSAAGTTSVATLSVTASNCWLIGGTYAPGGYTVSGGSVIRTPSDIGAIVTFDSNATVGTGSQTVTVNNTSNPRLVLGLAIKPNTTAATSPTTIAGAKATGVSAGTSRTLSITIPTGYSNLGLVLFCFNITGNAFTSATHNGVSMTMGASNTPGFSFRSQLFYLANPATGANNIVVNWTGVDTSVAMLAVALRDVNQAAMLDLEGYTAVNQVATITKSLTTTANGDLLLAAFAIQATATAQTESGSQKRELQGNNNLGSTNFYGEIASLPKATAGSQAMALSWTTNRDADELVAAIKFASTVNSGFFMAAAQ